MFKIKQISQEDNKEFKIDELFHRYDFFANKMPDKKEWIVNETKDIWLLKGYIFPKDKDNNPSTQSIWALYYKGEIIDVYIDEIQNTEDKTYSKVWKLLRLNPETTPNISDEKIVEILKELFENYVDKSSLLIAKDYNARYFNEMISDEDIEKFGLYDLYHSYNSIHTTTSMLEDRQPWVINKQRDIWLMKIHQFESSEFFDHGFSSEYIWILYYKGEKVEVYLNATYQREIDNIFYDTVWEVFKLNPKSSPNISKDEIVKLLKDMLEVYAKRGVRDLGGSSFRATSIANFRKETNENFEL